MLLALDYPGFALRQCLVALDYWISRRCPETVLDCTGLLVPGGVLRQCAAALDYFTLSSSSSGLLGYPPGGVLRQCWQHWTISLCQVQALGYWAISRRRPETVLVALDYSTLSSSSSRLWRKANDLLCGVQLQWIRRRSEAAAPFQLVVLPRRSRGVRQRVQPVLPLSGEAEVEAEEVPSLV